VLKRRSRHGRRGDRRIAEKRGSQVIAVEHAVAYQSFIFLT
jgi:hypothetical protein